jgi:transcription elongation factor Elf1
MAEVKKHSDYKQRCLICGNRLTYDMLVADKNPYDRHQSLAQCTRCGAVCAVQVKSNLAKK